jgi:hypothetical protein
MNLLSAREAMNWLGLTEASTPMGDKVGTEPGIDHTSWRLVCKRGKDGRDLR